MFSSTQSVYVFRLVPLIILQLIVNMYEPITIFLIVLSLFFW